MSKSSMTLLVSGRVQGVGFRAHTQKVALRLGLCGYVENLSDGRVRIVAQGDENQLQALADWATQGPAWAAVDAVERCNTDATDPYLGFVIRR